MIHPSRPPRRGLSARSGAPIGAGTRHHPAVPCSVTDDALVQLHPRRWVAQRPAVGMRLPDTEASWARRALINGR